MHFIAFNNGDIDYLLDWCFSSFLLLLGGCSLNLHFG